MENRKSRRKAVEYKHMTFKERRPEWLEEAQVKETSADSLQSVSGKARRIYAAGDRYFS